MTRPWQVWLALAACGAVLTAAMGWLTIHALRADRERSAARAAADLEQRVSLALWRMDTKLAPLIAEESARPHFLYAPFISVEAPAAGDATAPTVVPSPLLTGGEDNVLLNFVAADGMWTSPQAPPPEQAELACSHGMTLDQIAQNRGRLERLAVSVDFKKLLADLPERSLPVANSSQAVADELADVRPLPSELAAPYYANQEAAEAQALNGTAGVDVSGGLDPGTADRPADAYAAENRSRDLGERSARYQQQVGQEFVKQRRENLYRVAEAAQSNEPVLESISRPLWVGDQLLLARRVVRGGKTAVQGSWLNWPRLKSELLAESADLLPGADLAAVRPGETSDPTRMLAGLPVRLVMDSVGPPPTATAAPLAWALGVGWGALAAALAALAALVWGVLALSERRGAFVSSVTHELRTPLTTFRMYAEMLARDMVPSAERRREYLETLRTEAERLTHLVDNVLAYARLERGRRPQRSEQTTPGRIVERAQARLAERATGAGMTLECAVDPAAAEAALRTDVGVVEQILFNLVDNAVKYAARAEDRRIHLEATRDRRIVVFAVRDHGPGFASPRAAERAAPFSKSAEAAAESGPGVGLGLALCRRLARELGGSLAIVQGDQPTGGCAVTLRLPLEP